MFRLVIFLLASAWFSATAQAQPAQPAGTEPPARAGADDGRLPPPSVTHQTLELPGRTLHFTATAGAIRLTDEKNAPRADVAFIAYALEGAAPAARPVTFAFNGGPGMASGWLQVGAIGPWRLRLGADAAIPSSAADPVANPETWLDFTDLVFIDPPGTGYSRVLTTNEEARRRIWSVEGDIGILAEAVRHWLDRNGRNTSPKFLAGESYGGFRAPRLARELQSDQGTGIAGLVLISPALDLAALAHPLDPLALVARLPSQTAAARAAKGPVTRSGLTDVEEYAQTDFIVDLLRGERDQAAIARITERVAAFTGLDPAVVQRYHGRLSNTVFLHEIDRAEKRVASGYDATITMPDPFPLLPMSDYADPILEGMKAPVTSAMMAIYQGKLSWRPEQTYQLANDGVFRQWDWGHGQQRANSVWPLQAALALDPHMRVLIAHGMFDLVTPYFGTVLLLDQMPGFAVPDRVRLEVYPGGHMFYSNDASRAAFHDAAQALVTSP